VTPRPINPDQLTVLEQPVESVGAVKPNLWPPLGITGPGRDVASDQQSRLGGFRDQVAGLTGCETMVALPTAT
jgi:hypothetical protein